MQDMHSANGQYTEAQGVELALSYLKDPSDVVCPECGPGNIEVACWLDARLLEAGMVEPIAPREDGQHVVVLACHRCRRTAALDFSVCNFMDKR